jgi:hypothetical protein
MLPCSEVVCTESSERRCAIDGRYGLEEEAWKSRISRLESMCIEAMSSDGSKTRIGQSSD